MRRSAELAAASEADATDQIQRLFNEALRTPAGGLDAMFAVVSRLRTAGQTEALLALQARVKEARGTSGTRTAVVLAGLAAGLAAALDPNFDPALALAELVDLATGLQAWDQSLALRAVLPAIEPLPIETRRAALVPLYRELRSRRLLRDWSGQQIIRVDEQRVLFCLVNLLVVPVDETPEAERLRRAEWTALRVMIRRDLESARAKT